MDNYAKSRHDMIFNRYLLTELILNLKSPKHIIKEGYGLFEGSSETMIDLDMYKFKYLNTGKIKP